MRSYVIFFLLFFSPALMSGQSEEDLQESSEAGRVWQEVHESVVRINTVAQRPFRGRMRKIRASGSGVIITTDGKVLTNYHVIRKAVSITCWLTDETEVKARLTGFDVPTDLALLELITDGDDTREYRAANFGDSSEVRAGDRVFAVGSPGNLSQSITEGIISNPSLSLPDLSSLPVVDGELVGYMVKWIAHDARIFPGNSGGPLLNAEGRLIGINEIGVAGLGGAIPGNLARAIANQLIEAGEIIRGWLGILWQPLPESSEADEGVLAATVFPEGPAFSAGLRSGDRVTAIAGQKIHARTWDEILSVRLMVHGRKVGTSLELEWFRDDDMMRKEIPTERLYPEQGNVLGFPRMGIVGQDFTPYSALLQQRPDSRGVRVLGVRDGFPAADAKPALRAGDVIRKADGRLLDNTEVLSSWITEQRAKLTKPSDFIIELERNREVLLTALRMRPDEAEEPTPAAKKGWLGVATQVVERRLSRALSLENSFGVRVTRVYPATTAESHGIQVGDIVYKIDDEPIRVRREEDINVFPSMIRQYRPGMDVELTMSRGGEVLRLTVPLEAQPLKPSEIDRYKAIDLEFACREITFEDREEHLLNSALSGIIVDTVEPAGWADIAGLRADDVIVAVDGFPIAALGAFVEYYELVVDSQNPLILVKVKRGALHHFLEIEPVWE